MMEFKPIQYLCECRKEVLQSKYEGEFVSCSCNKCFVDQTRHYTRGGGYVVPKDEWENSLGKESAQSDDDNCMQ